MDKLENKKLAIIGVGNMGSSFRKGLLNSGFKSENIILSRRAEDNKKVIAQADWILLAVKPLVVKQVLTQVNDLARDKLILSIAAGVSISNIKEYINNKNQKVIRLMPNIPVAINNGVIGMYSNKNVSWQLKNKVKIILSALGIVLEFEREEDIDSLMFISACGPAIVSYFIEMLSKNGQILGLSKKVSEKVALETINGTLLYLREADLKPIDLQQSVSTKGGITEEIIKSLNKYQLEEIFAKSIQNGYAKLRKLKASLK